MEYYFCLFFLLKGGLEVRERAERTPVKATAGRAGEPNWAESIQRVYGGKDKSVSSPLHFVTSSSGPTSQPQSLENCKDRTTSEIHQTRNKKQRSDMFKEEFGFIWVTGYLSL